MFNVAAIILLGILCLALVLLYVVLAAKGFPRTNAECGLGDKCVDNCTNCTIGWRLKERDDE